MISNIPMLYPIRYPKLFFLQMVFMQQIIKTRIQVGVGTVRIKIPKILLVCNFIVCYLYNPITQCTVLFHFAPVAEAIIIMH